MSKYVIRIKRCFQGYVIRFKALEKVFSDLEDIKVDQDEILNQLDRQNRMLWRILQNTQPDKVVYAIFRVTDQNGFIIEEATSVEMKIQQRFSCSVAFEDQAGNPATVDEAPLWSADPPDLLTLEPGPDGMSVMVTAGTKAGSTQLLCKADADMGEGTTEITGMLAVTVLPGDAVTVTLNPGEVEDAPVARPKRR